MSKSFLLELRDLAKRESNLLTKKQMTDAADRLDYAITTLFQLPTRERMINLNGAWAHALRMANRATPEPENPSGARMRFAA